MSGLPSISCKSSADFVWGQHVISHPKLMSSWNCLNQVSSFSINGICRLVSQVQVQMVSLWRNKCVFFVFSYAQLMWIRSEKSALFWVVGCSKLEIVSMQASLFRCSKQWVYLPFVLDSQSVPPILLQVQMNLPHDTSVGSLFSFNAYEAPSISD